jgi:hypothetical protein
MKDGELNPFKIDIAHNGQMGGYEVLLQVGGLKDERQAQRFADVLIAFMTDDGEKGWHARVQ